MDGPMKHETSARCRASRSVKQSTETTVATTAGADAVTTNRIKSAQSKLKGHLLDAAI